MSHHDHGVDWEQVIRDMIQRNTESAPTEPGVYRMPCGNCYVDFFRASDGSERWLVPGDERSYTRDTISTFRHGEHPWERMYTLAHAAAEIRRRATAESTSIEVIVSDLASIADAEDAAEEEEIARIARERPADSEEIPLAELAQKFGIDLDEL
ncbi:MAG: zinc ABC transporter ATPase [Croceicoccus sp.]|uniref:zinc ABC transporter ATPase n=1 Tax=Microbacterium sp. TaxID=51671 RepID=UPI000C38FC4C|nr:zinc ABC transporter ATPase [Microbacterium sp.]MAL27741.1 zinc ABC transporter ATPase [Croceicoccus sp.]MAY50576.1 zinc ABC transporter ATPase [Microbacterium sp.]|tara:strand:- start:49 stop:510 length:462 start_codon:yes stop_codon:yes gene_type:complete